MLTCVVSADMADAMHPSQVSPPGQEETFHQPKLRDGLVLKHDAGNSNDIVTSFLFREVAKRNSIPTQVCGSSHEKRALGCSLPLTQWHW